MKIGRYERKLQVEISYDYIHVHYSVDVGKEK